MFTRKTREKNIRGEDFWLKHFVTTERDYAEALKAEFDMEIKS